MTRGSLSDKRGGKGKRGRRLGVEEQGDERIALLGRAALVPRDPSLGRSSSHLTNSVSD